MEPRKGAPQPPPTTEENMTTPLDRETANVFVVTAIYQDGVRRDLWFGKSLRDAVRHQNIILPKKYGRLFRDFEILERMLAP